jgi:hypothetical protein
MLKSFFKMCDFTRTFTRLPQFEFVSKSFRTGRLEREPQMVQLPATRCSCITILWVSLVSFAAITLCVASQRVFIVVYFVTDSAPKLLDTPSYISDLNISVELIWRKTLAKNGHLASRIIKGKSIKGCVYTMKMLRDYTRESSLGCHTNDS